MKEKIKGIPKKLTDWWNAKTTGAKVISALTILAIAALLFIGTAFAKDYYTDMKRRTALTATDASGRPLNSRVHNGKVYVPNPDITTYLFLGIDRKEEVDESGLVPGEFGQADAIMLAAVDTKADTVKVVNIPRDSIVNVKRYDPDGSQSFHNEEQITLQYAFGRNPEHCVELMENAITEQIFKGLTIDHYATLNLIAVAPIIDDMGGISITMSDDYIFEGPSYEAGKTYHMEGAEALLFATYRDMTVYGSSISRTERQKDFLKAFYADAKEAVKKDPSLIASIYGDIKDNMHTDLSLTDMVSLATDVLGMKFSSDDITILPGELGVAVNEYLDGNPHQTYILDKEGTLEILLDTWYLPYGED